jgi:arginase
MHATWAAQSEAVLRNIRLGKVPVVISGDHASAGGTIAGIKMAHPEKRLGVVWIDAHADLHSPFTTPSGNVHGMPLAASIAEDNIEMRRNYPNEETLDYWERMKAMGGITPKILPQDLIFVGVRETEKEEVHLMDKYKIINYEVEEVDEMGMTNIGNEILEELKQCDIIYVSFDVDSMDPDEVSYGTGTPVQDGITPEQAKILLNTLLASPKVCCFEMVEVNPLLDKKGNKMATTALSILEKAVEIMENR